MTRGAIILGIGAMVALGGAAVPARAATCWDKASIGDYDPNLIRAVQERLRDKGLYAGAIDGRPGPGTRRALARLTGGSPRSSFRLGSAMVEQLFGFERSGIYESEQQDALMGKLGVAGSPDYRDKCRVRVVEE